MNKIQNNWKLIAAAGIAILLWKPLSKLLKGLAGAAGFVGDVLSAPGDIVKYLNKEHDEQVEQAIEQAYENLCRETVFDNSNKEHRKALDELRQLAKVNPKFFTPLIKIWQQPKEVVVSIFGVKYYKRDNTGLPGSIGYSIGQGAEKKQIYLGVVALVVIVILIFSNFKKK